MKDSAVPWTSLKDLNTSNPVEIAEYLISRDMVSEPVFAWWLPFTLRKRDRITTGVDYHIRKSTHPYGIKTRTSVKLAEESDKKNKNTSWMDAIILEMYNVGVAFKILEPKENPPPGYSKLSRHTVYDAKTNFTRKGR